MHKLLTIIFIPIIMGSCSFSQSNKNKQESKSLESNIEVVDFWNGTRSEVRQKYERQGLEAVLTATESDFGHWEIKESVVEYPGEKESYVFSKKNHHVFVTIAGSQNFKAEDRIAIHKPLTRNLPGYRVQYLTRIMLIL